MEAETITLLELAGRIATVVSDRKSGTQNVWVTAELSDVSTKGGHTYMELLQKDDRGNTLAKIKAMIWRSNSYQIQQFTQISGHAFASGIKVKVRVSASVHPVFGLSVTISEIDPYATMGDLYIRRQQILKQLTDEGVIDDNKKIEWDSLSLRIAVISASQAAGYGDFMKHLTTGGTRFRFTHKLFEAVMQGEKTVQTVSEALQQIENELDRWDCVVIIRGGGATSDLVSFESHELAYRVATFPLPVIVGIGHERDETVLDYVANQRVKTPTAAADILLNRWNTLYQQLLDFGRELEATVNDRVQNDRMQLSFYQTNLESFPVNALKYTRERLVKASMTVENLNNRILLPAKQRLEAYGDKLAMVTAASIASNNERLAAMKKLLSVLSPVAVLKRGYTLTMRGSKFVKSASEVPAPGDEITTIFSDGKITSIIK